MGIIKSTNNNLQFQLKAQYPVDRVSKSTFCLAYSVDEPDIIPSKGKISIGPTLKPSQTTVVRINYTALQGASIENLLKYATEGSIKIYFKPNADNFALFKINSASPGETAIEYSISSVLSSDAFSILEVNSQVCLDILPAPTSEALTVIDGGYY
jgi:hypothetical protein